VAAVNNFQAGRFYIDDERRDLVFVLAFPIFRRVFPYDN